MAGVIRILLIFFVFILVARLIRRFIFPLLFKKTAERMERNMKDYMDNMKQQKDDRKEGEIRVEKTEISDSGTKKEGEYVEYEEVN